MEYLYIFVAMVGLAVVLGAISFFFQRLDQGGMERPKIIVDVAEELGLDFEKGRWRLFVLSHQNAYEEARASGSYRDREVEVVLTCRVVKPEDAGKSGAIRLYAGGICAEPVVRVRLPVAWRGVELRRRGFDVTGNEISGVDRSIGDDYFDDEYVLAGDVREELRQVLGLQKVQWTLEELGFDFVIRDGFLERPLGIDFDEEEIVEGLDELIDGVDELELASREENAEQGERPEVAASPAQS